MVDVPVPLHCQKPCKASCRTMELRRRILTIDAHTFQMTSTTPMHMYPPPPFSMSTIVVHGISYGMYPSRNATCFILTNLSHASISGSFSLVASRSHDFRCSAFIHDGPPARPVRNYDESHHTCSF